MNKQNIHIASVTPIHNGLEDTKKFLASFYKSLNQVNPDKLKIDMYIVDDGSEDGSKSYIQSKHPDIKIIEGTGNLWWSGSVNLALDNLHNKDNEYDYILLFNNDNIIDDKYFKNLVNIIDSDNKSNILGSKVINLYPTSHYQYYGVRFNRWTTKYTKNPYPDQSYECNIAGGMGILIPIEIFKIVGFFDSKNFPQYHGDADFFIRADNKGYPIIYHPDLIIYNNNYSTGYKSNRTKKQRKNAYSYPKGYMNLLIDFKFYFRHSFFISALIRIILKNLKFLLKKK